MRIIRRIWIGLTRPLRTCVKCGHSARMPGVLYSHRAHPKFKGQDGKWRCYSPCPKPKDGDS